jgi:hypothetical protein
MLYTNSFTVPASDEGVTIEIGDGAEGYLIPTNLRFYSIQLFPEDRTVSFEFKGAVSGSDWILAQDVGPFVMEGIVVGTKAICSIRPENGVAGDAFTCNILLKGVAS